MKWPKAHGLELTYIVLVLAFYVMAAWVLDTNAMPGIGLEIKDSSASTLIQLIVGQIQTLLGLNSAIFAVSGALAIKGGEWSRQWTRLDAVLVLLAIASGAIGYQGALIANAALAELVAANNIDLTAPRLVRGMILLKEASSLGLFIVGWVFVRLLTSRRNGKSSS